MNDQHPHAGYVGYDSHSTGGFDNDPLFGSLPGGYDGSYDTTPGYAAPYDSGQAGHSGQYDTTQWDTGAHRTAEYDHAADYAAYTPHPQQHPQYETAPQYDAAPQYDTTTAWAAQDGYGANIPAQGGAPDASGQWDTSGWYANGQWSSTDTAGYDSGAYDATAWNTGATPEHGQRTPHDVTESHEPEQTAQHPYETHETYEVHEAYEPYEDRSQEQGQDQGHAPAHEQASYDSQDSHEPGAGHEAGPLDQDPSPAPAESRRPASHPVSRGSRSRRRSPAKRSALLTVAVPSACVMSVAGIAAASVGGMGGGEEKKDDTTTMAAADPGTVKPVAANNKLDTQLANLSADAENFADRASRTQERIDLKERQAAEKKKRIAEAARKEALRPKYVMPVKEHGLSAYFGQAGVNWMSVHTGIDFPVLYGTPVMAATDGTVHTQFNTAYGNMAIVTMADGTETWYCHLSSTRIRSGPVKAGDVIAYSGDSGNSTGPHLHFEVRPGGGAAIDPLPWLRSHNVDPT
ncbi:peptidoglycan DD-metalloendopeptidase family protein [Streptomyces laculatispora]|uniref:peptidoglycan DD-metalloendopeptidase family protein n=1 Tax=Streptomyces laculatispora TaxID=887464 RepID=UPI001A94B5E0|nr:peptidoglycan DD-metalloendopeptidase family protein [Streptomyces laculatispora]MBO0918811.1 peptidoglycan DD-metalloendopeptidase family protein [Streptomyces laculatispora]